LQPEVRPLSGSLRSGSTARVTCLILGRNLPVSLRPSGASGWVTVCPPSRRTGMQRALRTQSQPGSGHWYWQPPQPPPAHSVEALAPASGPFTEDGEAAKEGACKRGPSSQGPWSRVANLKPDRAASLQGHWQLFWCSRSVRLFSFSDRIGPTLLRWVVFLDDQFSSEKPIYWTQTHKRAPFKARYGNNAHPFDWLDLPCASSYRPKLESWHAA
jgi:hypothetical protein